LSPCPSLTQEALKKRALRCVLDYSAADGSKPFPEVGSQSLPVEQPFGLRGKGQREQVGSGPAEEGIQVMRFSAAEEPSLDQAVSRTKRER